MHEDMQNEAIELISTVCEKYADNYLLAAQTIKETMDKRFGMFWHACVGEGFGYELSYETKHLLYLFFSDNLAIVLWKC